ncbi:MAG: hypothetical protein A2Z27_02190 [candidate division Zixibacteria bacterium RBG_16_50_21]|nr:MAG: hypothetical protein A2Z27_02190 [candidate division Zixibacteria bacterium RBG_16_50_21]
MSLTPSGRLSAIETEKGVLQIQTEFTLSPSKNIVTSHIFSGRVIRKRETPWPHIIENDSDRLKAEEILARLHKEEVELAISSWEELILPILSEIEKSTTEQKLEELKRRLAVLPGIKKILLLDEDLDYLVIKSGNAGPGSGEIDYVRKSLDLCKLITSASRVGKPVQIIAQYKERQQMLRVWGEKFLLFETEADCDLNKLKTNIQLALAGV